MSHPGIVRMKEIARSFVWWPNCDKDIEGTVRNCSKCQQVKSPPAVNPLTPWSWPAISWTRMHNNRLCGTWETAFPYSSRCALVLARNISYAEYH